MKQAKQHQNKKYYTSYILKAQAEKCLLSPHIRGRGRPAITGNKWLRRLWLFTFLLVAWELMAANQQDSLSPNCPWLHYLYVRLFGPKTQFRKRL